MMAIVAETNIHRNKHIGVLALKCVIPVVRVNKWFYGVVNKHNSYVRIRVIFY